MDTTINHGESSLKLINNYILISKIIKRVLNQDFIIDKKNNEFEQIIWNSVKNISMVCWDFLKLLSKILSNYKSDILDTYLNSVKEHRYNKFNIFYYNNNNGFLKNQYYTTIIRTTPYSKIKDSFSHLEKLIVKSDIYAQLDESDEAHPLAMNFNYYPPRELNSLKKVIDHSHNTSKSFLVGYNKTLLDYILIHCNCTLNSFTYELDNKEGFTKLLNSFYEEYHYYFDMSLVSLKHLIF